MNNGFVALVGAGPGEASLLTLRAKELIENCDVVVYDRLVSDEIMDLIPRNTEKINVGKQSSNHTVPQNRINEILLEEALKGKFVVRLKGGDPFVFGRGGEELDLLIENQVKFEVVPGITSAIAAPNFAGIPVTHRDFCSSFHVITGHQKENGKLNIDFESLVKINGTLIFLMGVSSLKSIQNGLLEAGMDENMPTALVENGTRPYQRKVVSVLKNIDLKAQEEKIKSPAIIIVGKTCSLSNSFDWFSTKELFGKKIIVTSPLSSNGKLKSQLKKLGANVINMPMIDIVQKEFDFSSEIENIKNYTWMIFTSQNAVHIFFKHLKELKKDLRCLANLKFAAIGPSTSSSLENYGIFADYIPSKFNSENLAKGLTGILNENDNVLLFKAEIGSTNLVESFKENNISYKEYKIYKTEKITSYKDEVMELTQNPIPVAFTSASTVSAFVENCANVENVTAFCIGNETEKKAKEFGFKTYTSEKSTIQSLVETIKNKMRC